MKECKARELFDLARAYGWSYSHASGSHHIYIQAGKGHVSIPGPANRIVGAGLATKIVKQIKS